MAEKEEFIEMYSSSVRVYLTANAIQILKERADSREIVDYEIQIEKDEHYVVVPDFTDPLVPLPKIPTHFISKVTYRGTLSQKSVFRAEGIYRFGKALLSLKNTINPHTTPPLCYQHITAEARGLRSLRQIYTKVRQGLLEPAENWGLQTN